MGLEDLSEDHPTTAKIKERAGEQGLRESREPESTASREEEGRKSGPYGLLHGIANLNSSTTSLNDNPQSGLLHEDVHSSTTNPFEPEGPRAPDLRELTAFTTKAVLSYLSTDPENLVEKIGHDNVQLLTNFLDMVLDEDTWAPTDRRNRILTLLSQIAVYTRIYPQRYILEPIVYDTECMDEGGFGDVYQALGGSICVKVMKRTNDKALKSYVKELILWSRISHPNILPFFGIFLSRPNHRMCLVSPWMKNGNLCVYSTTLSQKDRLPLLLDVAEGMVYLHELGIVHSDIKGQNVLVSNEGRALITDFGASHITTNTMKQGTTQSIVAHSANFSAPEVLRGMIESSSVRPSKPCDSWSFGCLCYEILTQKTPFDGFTFFRIYRIVWDEQGHPGRPLAGEGGCEEVADESWALMIACWKFDPHIRPDFQVIRRKLRDYRISDDRPVAKLIEKPETIKALNRPDLDLIRIEHLLRKFQSQLAGSIPEVDEVEDSAEEITTTGLDSKEVLEIPPEAKLTEDQSGEESAADDFENLKHLGQPFVVARKQNTNDIQYIAGRGFFDNVWHRLTHPGRKTKDFPIQSFGVGGSSTSIHQDVHSEHISPSNTLTQDVGSITSGSLRFPFFRRKLPAPMMQPELLDLPSDLSNLGKDITRHDIWALADYLDQALAEEGITGTGLQNRLLNLLSQLVVTSRAFPRRIILQPIRHISRPKTSGTFGDVHLDSKVKPDVCVKIIKCPMPSDSNIKSFIKEIILWSYLSHPNILPFYGFYWVPGSFIVPSRPHPAICLVLPWMRNGNLRSYTAELTQSDRMPLLNDVANGLKCLHALGIVHGDIKCQNVLISNEGRALITDIGIPHFVTPVEDYRSNQSPAPLNTPFAAPEMYQHVSARPTKAGDIWSFGCLCFEVLSRRLLFYGYDTAQITRILCVERKLPERSAPGDAASEPIHDEAWALITSCWSFDPRDRPNFQQIQDMVARLVLSDYRPAPRVVEKPRGIKTESKPNIARARVEEILRSICTADQV